MNSWLSMKNKVADSQNKVADSQNKVADSQNKVADYNYVVLWIIYSEDST